MRLHEIAIYRDIDQQVEQTLKQEHSSIFRSSITTHHPRNIWISSTLTTGVRRRGAAEKLVMVDHRHHFHEATAVADPALAEGDGDVLLKRDPLRQEEPADHHQPVEPAVGLHWDESTLRQCRTDRTRVRSMALVQREVLPGRRTTGRLWRVHEKLCRVPVPVVMATRLTASALLIDACDMCCSDWTRRCLAGLLVERDRRTATVRLPRTAQRRDPASGCGKTDRNAGYHRQRHRPAEGIFGGILRSLGMQLIQGADQSARRRAGASGGERNAVWLSSRIQRADYLIFFTHFKVT